MHSLRTVSAFAVLTFLSALTPLRAQTLLNGDHSIDGRLCVGVFCTGGETFASGALKIRDHVPNLWFDDTGNDIGYPEHDWIIDINDDFESGAAHFSVNDVGGNSQPFRIWGNAPSYSFAIDWDGEIGLGTWLPEKKMHLVGGDNIGIRFEQDGSKGWAPYGWDIATHETAFLIRDHSNGSIPVWIETGGINNALVIEESGEVGLGLIEPTAALHLLRADGSAQVKVEETSAATTPRTLMNLLNNGRPEIVMGNTSTNGEWSFGAGTNFILKQGTLGSASSAKFKAFEIDPAGNAILAGSLTTGGTTCGGGCDRVFTENAVIPAADYAARMWAQGHLPHVGPTPEGAPINVSEKLGGMLNALEHAHVFIAEQRDEIDRLRARNQAQADMLAAVIGRLNALEARPRADRGGGKSASIPHPGYARRREPD